MSAWLSYDMDSSLSQIDEGGRFTGSLALPDRRHRLKPTPAVRLAAPKSATTRIVYPNNNRPRRPLVLNRSGASAKLVVSLVNPVGRLSQAHQAVSNRPANQLAESPGQTLH